MHFPGYLPSSFILEAMSFRSGNLCFIILSVLSFLFSLSGLSVIWMFDFLGWSDFLISCLLFFFSSFGSNFCGFLNYIFQFLYWAFNFCCHIFYFQELRFPLEVIFNSILFCFNDATSSLISLSILIVPLNISFVCMDSVSPSSCFLFALFCFSYYVLSSNVKWSLVCIHI